MIAMDPDVDGALARLVTTGTLSAEQADAVRREVDRVPGPEAGGREQRSLGQVLAEIGAYVGGSFVVAGISVFAGSNWDDLSAPVRMLVFGGPAALLAAAGTAIHRTGGDNAPARRLAGTLLAVAGGLLGGLAYQLLPPGDIPAGGWSWTVIWAVVTLAWAGAYVAVRAGVLHVALLLGAVVTAAVGADHVTEPHHSGSLQLPAIGGSILAVAAAWAVLALLGYLKERALGLTLAGTAAYLGAQYLGIRADTWSPWPGYVLTGLLAALCLQGYVRTRVVGLLVVGVVALATVIPEAVLHSTDGGLGTAGALLVAGLSIVGASALGLRLRREVNSPDHGDGG